MRFLRNLLLFASIAASVSIAPPIAHAQNVMTSFTASSVSAGPTPTTGTLCLTAVDRYGNPIPITRFGGGFYLQGRPFCGTLTAGVLIGTLSLPDSSTDSAPGHGYSMVIYDSVSKLSSTPLIIFNIAGASWSLDTYAPAASVSTTLAFTFSFNTGAPSGACNIPALYLQTVGNLLFVCGSDHAWHLAAGGSGGGAYTTFTMGSVTTLSPGSAATASFSGNSGSEILALGIPQGATGATGPAGAVGATGATGATGPAGFALAGPYNSGATYGLGAVVTYGSGTAAQTYESIQAANIGNNPLTSPSWWTPFADAPGAANSLAADTVNGKAISTNPSLTAFDVGAVAGVVAGSSQYPQSFMSASINMIQSRIPFIPTQNVDCPQVAWSTVAGTAESGGPQFMMRAALEYPAGTYYPLFFNGHRDTIVDPKGLPITDPACIDIPAGAVVYVRTLMQKTNLADTLAWPSNWTTQRYSGTTKLAPNVTDSTGQFDGAEALHISTYANGSITTGTGAFTDSTNTPFSSDQFIGQAISIAGAGTYASCAAFTGVGVGTGTTYCGTISAYTSTSAVTIIPNATTTVSGASYTLSPIDKTTGGTISASFSNVLAPIALLGQTPSPIKNVGFVGDSITADAGADYTTNMTGTWAILAISQTNLAAGKATIVAPGLPYTQSSMYGDTCSNYIVNHQTRFTLLGRTKKILGMLGTNDIFALSSTAATVEACLYTLWQQESVRGSAPYYGTIVPQTNSTTGWLDTANQTVKAQESVRVAVNGWLRDGAPFDCSTGLPAATGSSSTTVVRTNYYSGGALTTAAAAGSAATCKHSALSGGVFELADSVEVNSSNVFTRNGGLWAVDPNIRTLTGCSITGGSTPTVTCTGGTFTNADTGRVFYLAGGGQTTFTNTLIYLSPTTATLTGIVPNTVSGAVLTVDGAVESCTAGRYNFGDGVHPWYHGHCAMGIMAAAAPVAQWTF